MQVNTYWTWVDVQRADKYLAQLERMHTNGATGMEYAYQLYHMLPHLSHKLSRANFITGEFRKLGLTSHTQSYSFSDGGIVRDPKSLHFAFN
jgi:glycosylphosphatidylinositol transamidase